jgi:integrase
VSLQILTQELLDDVCCPSDKPHLELFDTLIKGFYVDVLRNGRMNFRVRYRVDGKARIKTLGDARIITLAEARDAARQVLRDIRSLAEPKPITAMSQRGMVTVTGEPQMPQMPQVPQVPALPEALQLPATPPINTLTVAEYFIEHYLPYAKSYKRSWVTDRSMINNHIVPNLGHLALGAVMPKDIAVAVSVMRDADYAPGTCNRFLVLLRYGFRLANRWQLAGVSMNPAQDLMNLRDDNRIERYLTPAQSAILMREIRQSPNQRLEAIVRFLVLTGARKREVLDAKWVDVDFDQRLWRIPKTKSGKIRHVPLSAEAMRVLGELKQSDAGHHDYVFCNPATGKPFISIYYSWDTCRRRAALPEFRIHDLRHSFASFLVNAGRSLYEVQQLLGHADIRTTSRYAHLSRDRLRDAVEMVPLGLAGA